MKIYLQNLVGLGTAISTDRSETLQSQKGGNDGKALRFG